MSLSESQKKHLRRLGHELKPVVLVGERGLSASLLEELDSRLAHHELIKVRVRAGDRGERDAIIGEMCSRGRAELVQRVGNMALVYRRNDDEPRILLPGS